MQFLSRQNSECRGIIDFDINKDSFTPRWSFPYIFSLGSFFSTAVFKRSFYILGLVHFHFFHHAIQISLHIFVFKLFSTRMFNYLFYSSVPTSRICLLRVYGQTAVDAQLLLPFTRHRSAELSPCIFFL